jgi:FkbM family methyltransferase
MSQPIVGTGELLARYAATVPALGQACRRERVEVGGLSLRIPGTVAIRASVLAGNVRMRAIVDRVVTRGATVVDVGANIGAIAAYMAVVVGRAGRVIAVEPAADNLAVLRDNLRANDLPQVAVVEAAAGRTQETRELYLRGHVSAVNSLYPDSCYASVTGTSRIDVVPLDDLVSGPADFVKIDVEGAELDVLAGMPRLLAEPSIRLAIEWHPALQQAAGFEPDRLPHVLHEQGFEVQAVSHLSAHPLDRSGIGDLCTRLLAAQHPVELFCARVRK